MLPQRLHVYAYDPRGLVAQRNDTVRNIQEEFRYDDAERLIEYGLGIIGSPATPRTVAYKYDLLGNLLTVDDNGVTAQTNVEATKPAAANVLQQQARQEWTEGGWRARQVSNLRPPA